MDHISKHLPTQNKEHQLPESKLSKSGSLLERAFMSQLMYRVEDSDLSTMLKYVMIKIGLRASNLPDELEKRILIDHIKKTYPNIHIDEIRLAFDMAIGGNLDINPDDVTCYENFSCQYFSRIMNAYLSWAANEVKYTKQEPPKQVIYSEQENDNLHRQLTEEFYQRLRSGYKEEVPDYIKDILVKDGIIKKDDSVVNFFVHKLGTQVKSIYEKI